MKSKVTLEKFYAEFVRFIHGNSKWQKNQEQRWEANTKWQQSQEQRWVANEKRWADNAKWQKRTDKQLRKIDRKIEFVAGFMDKEIMTDRHRITRLETAVFQ